MQESGNSYKLPGGLFEPLLGECTLLSTVFKIGYPDSIWPSYHGES
jgi:hypothetical protein